MVGAGWGAACAQICCAAKCNTKKAKNRTVAIRLGSWERCYILLVVAAVFGVLLSRAGQPCERVWSKAWPPGTAAGWNLRMAKWPLRHAKSMHLASFESQG